MCIETLTEERRKVLYLGSLQEYVNRTLSLTSAHKSAVLLRDHKYYPGATHMSLNCVFSETKLVLFFNLLFVKKKKRPVQMLHCCCCHMTKTCLGGGGGFGDIF